MNLQFKKAESSDTSAISLLAQSIWKKYYPSIISLNQINYMLDKMYTPEAIQHQIKEGQEFTLVYANKKLCGYLAMSVKNKKKFFLNKFYVDADLHGKGIGKHLFDYVITQLKNPTSIELTVNRKNIKAINFYFKLGFTINRVADFDIGNGFFMNDFVMLKKF
ncbi:MAG: GNAT family N-acetyltransferase [Bacteroidia bacterium]|nr:GNAT family N-acetyltransferase [Bacteroidia bacterium]